MRASSVLVSIGTVGLFACGGGIQGTGGNGGQGGQGGDLPCEIATMFATYCHDCHTAPPKFGAPMPLVDYGDLTAPAKSDSSITVAERVLQVLDPSSPLTMPPAPHPPPSAADVAALQAWVDGGYASGDACGSGGAGGGGAGGSPPVACATPSVQIAPAVPYTMPETSTNEYVCYGFDVPGDQAKRWIEAISPRIDNETILHHMLLLEAPSGYSTAPMSCDAFPPLDWKLLYGWGPGTPPHVLPADVGFPIDPSATVHYVMQIHYNNVNGLVGETDASGIDLCVTDQPKAHDADVLAIGNGSGFTLPANATSTVDCSLPLSGAVSFVLPLTIFQAWPHMHKLGRKLKSEVEHMDGSITSLGDSPNYDFNYQISYPVDAVLNAGDTLRTWCTFDNVTGTDVTYGENTENEMCFNFLAYYPKINFAQWNWILPSTIGNCQTYMGDPQP